MGTEGSSHAAGNTQDITPGIVGVPDNHSTGGVQKSRYIALGIGHIVVGRAIVEAERIALLLYSI